MSFRHKRYSALFGSCRPFANNKRGTAVIEFAILAPLFFAILFSGFEAGMMYLKIGMVDHGVSEISRQIYTGKAKGKSAEDVMDIFCDSVHTVIKCDGNVTLEIRKLSGYSSFDPGAATCVNTGEDLKDEDKPAYANTAGGDIVYIRVCVNTSLLVPGLKNMTFYLTNVGLQLPESAPGKYELTSSTVIRNEPF
ncbi:pilus assembly protein [Parvularcula flava]|uniref:Pilus assembly protein n=1 Tax=Aquisalinus luteolus TaxID=1566827 RepID=A0A8J3EQZ5_9PROT|nr:TadE/TadG family type IV pilus assembly protein [Aquisalinus luteolus]NHK28053.1 pilus assembly protein [Aquisalinus luteolus]GGH97318.1 hypothetical protein GCM10011355_18250 [Aquisalinus luteolus]